MKTKLAIAISSILALSACDDYKLGSEGENFNSLGSVAITGTTELTYTLTAEVKDANGFNPDEVNYTWKADDKIVSYAGSTYDISNADLGKQITVQVEYTDDAGNEELAKSVPTDAIEEFAVQIEGSATIKGDPWVGYVLEAIIEDENGTGDNDITYQWKAGGVNIGEPLVGIAGEKILLTEAEKDKEITVLLTYTDNDGFPEEFLSEASEVVTDKPADAIVTKVVGITDTFDDKAGQFRIKLSESSMGSHDPIGEGKLTVSFQKDNVVADEVGKDAYIAIYGTSTSTDDAIVDLKINNAGYAIRDWARNSDGSIEVGSDGKKVKEDIVITSPTYTPKEWVDVEIEWDNAGATTDVGPLVTVSIDGVQVHSATSTSDAYSSFINGVENVQFKLADSSSQPIGSFRVDDLVISSVKDGVATEVWADDFEAYAIGDSLIKGESVNGPEYNNNSFGSFIEEATILVEDDDGGTTPPPATGDNSYAASLADSDSSKDGELILYPRTDDQVIEKGRLTMSFYKPKDAKGSDDMQKDAYIGVYTSSGSNANALIDLRLHGIFPLDGATDVVDYGTFEQRNGSGLELDPAVILTSTDTAIVKPVGTQYNQGVHYTVGSWQDIEISWDATSTTEAADITVVYAGETYTFKSASAQDPASDGFEKLDIRFGDTSNEFGAIFQIDDVKVWSIDPVSGLETLHIDEDFETGVIPDETELSAGEQKVYNRIDQVSIDTRRL